MDLTMSCQPALRVSDNQAALWFLYKLAPESSAYNMFSFFKLGQPNHGPWRFDWLEESFYQAVNLNHSLRTGYTQENEQIIATLYDAQRAEFSIEQNSPADETPQQWAERCADRPLSLETGHVIRADLLIRGEHSYLTVTAHHIAADYYSMERFFSTWNACYRSLADGSKQPEVGEQFADKLRRDDVWLASEQYDQAMAFWKKAIGELPDALVIPTDYPRPDVRTFDGEELVVDADPALSNSVFECAKAMKMNVTPYFLMLSAFQYYLHRLSGQPKFLIGTPTLGRYTRQDQRVIGYCANPLVVPADFSEEFTFVDLIQRNQAFFNASRQHERLPFARLSKALLTERRADKSGLISHMLTYTHVKELRNCTPLMSAIPEGGQRGAAHELNLGVYKYNDDSLTFHWRFNSSLYRKETVAAMAADFFTLLKALLNEPNETLSSVVPSEWRHQHAVAAQTSAPEKPTALAVWQSRQATDTALLQDERAISVAELNTLANRYASWLRQRNGQSDKPVAVLLPRGNAQVAAMLSAWKTGAPYVPLDGKLPTTRLSTMLQDVQASACVGEGARPDWLPATVHWLDVESELPDAMAFEDAPVSATTPAYLIFTSGSTGQPKAVVIPHGALAAYVSSVNRRLALPAGSVYASLASNATDLAYTALWGGLLGGYPVRILDEDWMLDAEGLADHLAQFPVDLLKIVPSHLQGLLASDRHEILPQKALVLGGDGVTPDLLQTLAEKAPTLNVFNHYGPTETTVGVIAGKLNPGQPITLGTVLDGNEALVLNERQWPVPVGAVGELYIGGAQLAQGYWGDADKTALSFIDHPHQPGGRLYRTGDRVRRLPEGQFAFVGRADAQVKIRGYRVELAEIEQLLSRLPTVQEAAVHYQKTARAGGADRESLVAFVALKNQGSSAIDALQRAAAEALPSYMVPHFWQVVAQLPRHSNGKIDRKALREQAAERIAGPPETAVDSKENEAANLSLIEPIQQLFATVLHLMPEQVGTDQRFFALGGDSILALQLVAAARKAGFKLTPQLIFKHQTPTALAAYLEPQATKTRPSPEQTKAQVSVSRRDQGHLPDTLDTTEVTVQISQADLERISQRISPAVIDDILPLSPGQQGIFYHCQLANDPALYTNVTAMSVTGSLDSTAFLAAWQQAAQRHDIFRSQFVWQGLEQPVMVVCRGLQIQTAYQDWQHLPEHEKQQALDDFLQDEANNGFEIGHSSLMRVTLIRIDEDAYRLVWTRHHLVVDGWTSALVAGEAVALYQNQSLAPAPTLVNYSQWLENSDEQAAMDYWQQALAGVEAPTHLAQARVTEPVASQPTYRQKTLPDALLNALTQRARQHGLTMNTLMQLAWALTLNRATGQHDLVFGTTTSGRSEDVEHIQQTAGMFINTLPQRVRLDAQTSLAALAQTVQLDAAEARRADFISLSQIQSSLALPAGEALFDNVLVYQNYPFPPALTALETPNIALLSVGEHSNLPLMLQIEPGEGLHLHCRYDRARLPDIQVSELLTTFERVLQHLAHGLEGTVAQVLNALVKQEHSVAIAYGAKEQRKADDLITRIQRHAEQTPDKTALIAPEGHCRYRDLMAAIRQRARYFEQAVEQMPGAERTVAVALPRDAQLVISLLALYEAGITYIPLDPSHPKTRLESILTQANPALLLLAEPLALDTDVHTVMLHDVQAEERSLTSFDSTLSKADDDIAYRIFTSGSTGQPKGVQISRGALNHFMQVIGDAVPVSAESRLLAVTTVGFDIAALELMLPLLQGGMVVVADDASCKDMQLLSQQLAQYDITAMQATPATWHGLVEYEGDWWPTLDVLVGGEALPRVLAEKLLAKANSVTNLYGPTEATIWVSAQPVTQASLPQSLTNNVALGQPFANTELYVLDAFGLPVRPGVEGELFIGGAGLAAGYLHKPTLTAEKFVPHPFSDDPDARLYRTGDRVVMDADFVPHYLGRMDFQVKLRGFRIELGEIEALLQQHEYVREAVVVLNDDSPTNAFLAAYVSLTQNAPEAEINAVLNAHLAGHLPAYMVPDVIQILDALPLNTNGKVNRQALPKPTLGDARPFQAPQSETEKKLAELWQQILQIDTPSVADNFFHLGGNSLSATRLQARIQRTFNENLPLAEIFQNPTIQGLADRLSASQTDHDALAEMAALLDEFES